MFFFCNFLTKGLEGSSVTEEVAVESSSWNDLRPLILLFESVGGAVGVANHHYIIDFLE